MESAKMHISCAKSDGCRCRLVMQSELVPAITATAIQVTEN